MPFFIIGEKKGNVLKKNQNQIQVQIKKKPTFLGFFHVKGRTQDHVFCFFSLQLHEQKRKKQVKSLSM